MKNFLFNILLISLFFLLSPDFCYAKSKIKVEKNITKDEIILPENVELPHRDMNNDGIIDKNDIISDEVEENFFNFNLLENSTSEKETSLFEKILKEEVTKTDYSNYLLKDLLTVTFENGPVEKIQFYGKYRGNLSFYFMDNDFDSSYNITSIDLGMMGVISSEKNTDFKLQFKLTPTKDRTFFQQLISDAYVVNRSIPHHQIMIGNSRNQVGFEGGMSTTYLPFLLRSQIARNFGNTRAFGLKVIGNYSLADYSLAVNSSDRYFKEFFPGTEFTGWVNLKPLGLTDGKYGKIIAGGGINTGKNNYNYTVAGGYLGYTYKNFMINAEYSRANGYNGISLSPNEAEGFYVTTGYKITPKIQVVARYDNFNPNIHIKGNSKKEYSAGINYFIKGQGLRLLINYIFCDNDNQKDSHRLLFGTQFLL